MTTEVLDVGAIALEFEEPKEGHAGKPHRINGETVTLHAWNALQIRSMVQFIRLLLSHDPALGVSEKDPAVEPALRNAEDLTDVRPDDLMFHESFHALKDMEIAEKIMDDWIHRFGALFGYACKNEHYSVEDVQRAIDAYQKHLIAHVWELRRIIHLHTGTLPSIAEVFSRVRSRFFGAGSDAKGGNFLEFGTMYPSVRTGENGLEKPLLELAETEQVAPPDDPFAYSVDGERQETLRLITLLFSKQGKVTILDAQRDRRFEDRLRLHKTGTVSL